MVRAGLTYLNESHLVLQRVNNLLIPVPSFDREIVLVSAVDDPKGASVTRGFFNLIHPRFFIVGQVKVRSVDGAFQANAQRGPEVVYESLNEVNGPRIALVNQVVFHLDPL